MAKDKPDSASGDMTSALVTLFIGRALGADPDIDLGRDLNTTLFAELSKDFDTIKARCLSDAAKLVNDLKVAGAAMKGAGTKQ